MRRSLGPAAARGTQAAAIELTCLIARLRPNPCCQVARHCPRPPPIHRDEAGWAGGGARGKGLPGQPRIAAAGAPARELLGRRSCASSTYSRPGPPHRAAHPQLTPLAAAAERGRRRQGQPSAPPTAPRAHPGAPSSSRDPPRTQHAAGAGGRGGRGAGAAGAWCGGGVGGGPDGQARACLPACLPACLLAATAPGRTALECMTGELGVGAKLRSPRHPPPLARAQPAQGPGRPLAQHHHRVCQHIPRPPDQG